jgi:transposase
MRKRRERDGQKQSHWQEVVRRQAESGQSVRDYCHQAGIKEAAFYWWRRELARRSQQGKNLHRPSAVARRKATERPLARKSADMAARFLPLQVVADRRCEDACGLDILLGDGRTLRVRPGFDRQTLADVLAVLEVRPC